MACTMRNPLDNELPGVRRTVRELLLIGGGGAFTVSAIFRKEPWLFVGIYGLATLLVAARFFPARAFAVATSIAAITQQLICSEFSLRWHSWVTYFPFAVLGAMLSRDLTERFDRAPSGISWLPNRWATLPESDARRLRICSYAVAAQAAALFCGSSGDVLWPKVAMGLLWGTLALLTMGRAIAVVFAPLITLPVAYLWATELRTRAFLVEHAPAKAFALHATGPVCAAIACAVALPYFRQVIRLLRTPA